MKDIPSMNYINNNTEKDKKKNVFTEKYYKNFFGALKNNEKNIKNPNSVYNNINLPDKYKDGILIKNQELIKKIKEKKEKEILQEKLLKKRENKEIITKEEEKNNFDFFKEKNELIFQDPSYIKKEVENIFKNYKKLKKDDFLKDKNIYTKNKKKKN